MDSVLDKRLFLRSRSAQGLALYLLFCLVVAVAVGSAFYSTSVNSFVAHKGEEKITALRLVDAFVQNYSALRTNFGPKSPVPSTFRAHSIELFNKADKAAARDFHLQWVGRKDSAIATPPSDAAMAAAIEAFAHEADPKPRSEFLTLGGSLVLRTTYPSFAQQQSCVDCHNEIQPNQHWKLGDLMGAFVIDVPAAPAMRESLLQAVGLGVVLFLVLGAAGFTACVLHFRQTRAREAVQASLRESEERLRDYVATASDWFWEQDEDFRFVYTSSGAPHGGTREILGKTRRGLVECGENFGISEEQLAAHESDLAAHKSFQNVRFQRRRADGEVRYISVSGRPVFAADGAFKGYRGTGRDITAEVAAEIELGRRVEERTQQLRTAQSELVRREKLSTLGQLTATVAHELRNPLSAIRNTVYAVKESVAAKGVDLERPLTRVERNIQRCDRIITDLLDFTRMRELNCAVVEADHWLEEILDEQRVSDGIVLKRDFGAAGRRVNIDVERMRRVVINLVDNAAQAMAAAAADGERSITVSTRAEGPVFELVVLDTGPGMPADVLAKVFEPLFSTKSFGTGLGLPTVKQIIEQHGGTVQITSEVGQGTRVVVRLPGIMVQEMAA